MNQDSKSSIKVFSDLCSDVYISENIDVDNVVKKLNESLLNKSITEDVLSKTFVNCDLYDKQFAFPVLALLQSIDTKPDLIEHMDKDDWYAASQMDYSKAISYLQQWRNNIFHIDHIMHQTPKDDSLVKYRVVRLPYGKEVLHLLEGHDFPGSINGIDIVNDMQIKTFRELTINRVGNLRLITQHVNEKRKNKPIYLDEDSDFTTYNEMVERSKKLANYFFKCPDLQIK